MKKEKKETCFLFHDWGKWEQYEEKGIMLVSLYIDQKKEYKYTDQRQKRKCKRCGTVQDRLIKGYKI